MTISQKLLSASRSTLFEFIIIVLGVLVALGVDAWQEERAEMQRLQRYLAALSSEIEQNFYSIDMLMETIIPRKLDRLERIITALETDDVQTLSSEEFLSEINRSTFNVKLWFTRNSYDTIISSGGFKRLNDPDLEGWLSGSFAAPGVLLPQADSLRGNYPYLVSAMLPASLSAHSSPMAGYADSEFNAPAVKDPQSAQATAEHMLASRDLLLSATRAEVAYATAVWYSLARLKGDFSFVQKKLLEHPLLHGFEPSNPIEAPEPPTQ